MFHVHERGVPEDLGGELHDEPRLCRVREGSPHLDLPRALAREPQDVRLEVVIWLSSLIVQHVQSMWLAGSKSTSLATMPWSWSLHRDARTLMERPEIPAVSSMVAVGCLSLRAAIFDRDVTMTLIDYFCRATSSGAESTGATSLLVRWRRRGRQAWCANNGGGPASWLRTWLRRAQSRRRGSASGRREQLLLPGRALGPGLFPLGRVVSSCTEHLERLLDDRDARLEAPRHDP